MIAFVHRLGEALLFAVGMAWQVGWSLMLGLTISGAIQVLVPSGRMQSVLGRDGLREIARATLYGAASSSCSYAASSIAKTLIGKGAGLIPSLAFLFASTNLVVELGVILYLLLGWQFTAGEWIGGLVLIAIMSGLVKCFYPRALIAEARARAAANTVPSCHGDDDDDGDARTLWQRLRDPSTPVLIARNVAMDWSMLGKDLTAGFLIAGVLAAFVPDSAWHTLFFNHAAPGVRLVADAAIGPLVAIVSFVCSIGNVPLAAILWSGGVSFGGVLAFLYADLIVLPLLDVYRRYFGWRMAAYIGVVFFLSMALASIAVDLAFSALHLVPTAHPNARSAMLSFSLNYTFWLNLAFAVLGGWFWYVNRQHPMQHHHEHHEA